MRLLPLEIWFEPLPGPLLPQLRSDLAAAARAAAGVVASPLRWAITAAEPGRGLRVEAVLVLDDPPTATAKASAQAQEQAITTAEAPPAIGC